MPWPIRPNCEVIGACATPGTDIVSFSPWWGREGQTESMNIPLMIGTGVSHNSGIITSKGNLVSCVQAGGNENMSFVLAR